ncbi:hypothetical protein BDV26DRAFT_300126 [Aspergillus bertholletiae]|uniref:Uncharacterized protein n=1 Tax=Aspergillus bertholletiae TaxID=1226010 RepID=A0A5N7AZQ8_9EURO|nr:hypothetical protein BDV26DRAFT_300126 [Aspergillus bertholletiae]
MSPLLQGKELGPKIRHKFVQLLEDSPDPEINSWPNVRNSLDYKRQPPKERLPYRRHMSAKDYYAALHQAIERNKSLKGALLMQEDSNGWGALERELLDIGSWFESTSSKIRQQEPKSQAEFVAPVGTTAAPVSIILDYIPLHKYTGFAESNSLIWMYNLQKYVHIPGSFQAAPPHSIEKEILRTATRKLIPGSQLRVIIACGDCVEEAALPDDAPLKKVTLSLAEIEHDAWIEARQHKITRIFIRAPAPLSKLRAKHGTKTFQLTNVFRFVSTITDLKIFLSFYESALCVSLIVRRWSDEHSDKMPKASPTDLESLLRVWLATKGFDNSQIRRRGATHSDVLFKVKSLLTELNPQPNSPHALNEEQEDKDPGNASDVDESAVQEAGDTFGISTEEQSASDTGQDLESILSVDTSKKQVSIQPFINRLTLMLGHNYQGHWAPPNTWKSFIRHGSVNVKMGGKKPRRRMLDSSRATTHWT